MRRYEKNGSRSVVHEPGLGKKKKPIFPPAPPDAGEERGGSRSLLVPQTQRSPLGGPAPIVRSGDQNRLTGTRVQPSPCQADRNSVMLRERVIPSNSANKRSKSDDATSMA